MPKQTFLNLPEEKRERILSCATTEFAQRGHDAASISRIVEAAGIAKGSFYQYFEDKDDLFLYIVNTRIGSIKLQTFERESARLAEMNLSEFLRHVSKTQLREFGAHPELMKISMDLLRLPPDAPLYKKLMHTIKAATNTYFLPIIRQEIEQGEIDSRVNAHLLNFMLMGMAQYQHYMFNSGAASDFDEALIDNMIEDLDYILTNGIYTEKGRRTE